LSISASREAMMAQRLGRVLWRRRLVCAVVAAIVVVAGGIWLITREKIYQSSAAVALLPVTTNSGVLPNYPNLISSLIPTYIQLVSSPVLLDAVKAELPFAISEEQLANDLYAESLSNAAVITIVAQNPDPVRAQMIAASATAVFRHDLQGNRVVIPKVYGRATVPANPSSPKVRLALFGILVVAIVLGLGAGLIWERLSVAEAGPGAELPHADNGSAPAASRDRDAREPARFELSADEQQLLQTATDPQRRRSE
jgi:capsular polysaccharide biosynthesis protein